MIMETSLKMNIRHGITIIEKLTKETKLLV